MKKKERRKKTPWWPRDAAPRCIDSFENASSAILWLSLDPNLTKIAKYGRLV